MTLKELCKTRNRGTLPHWLIITAIILIFLLGWLFPVEGPLDFIYDKYASQPAHFQPTKKVPTRVAPVPKKEILIDLNEDEEPEWYWIIPKPTNIEEE